MPSSSSYPSLPIELIENIISLLWSSSLSADERITFMTSSTLVNKTWSHMFLCISLKDVHIPCMSYCHHYFRVFLEESPSLNDEAILYPPRLCQSMNMRIEGTPPYREPPMGDVLSAFLYYLVYFNLPNPRTVSIEYLNTGHDDIFNCLRFTHFPRQVTDVELNFTFDDRTPQWIEDRLRGNRMQHVCRHWLQTCLPCVRRLSIQGGSEAFITDMVTACPGMEMLEIDLPPGLEPSSTSSVLHLVNLLKRGVNLEDDGNESVPPNKLTVTSSVNTSPLAYWEGVQTKVFDNIYQFQHLDSF